ncbi:putative nucleotidyltransferase [Breznakia sp. PF5-3]|uniref:tRNA(Met) cytidine acetate ligase n=1 Tax=unclassified Breznakia TaxID=2623764 RepID=UPI002404F329|nr:MULTISPECIES: nucleotidyltransferase family protein [unclassified Breznakia]MDL2276809.1 nucleotidyltransferase family protein [Breznakia sp. OttesenSCG-928-G09]MDF9824059.1 putative nucleotidyltransferase [Breznakia sp. PM6-1]MDF9834875.1 putative nucleotidyltransferase [Breznakia sp. PF5-3]MDF9837103.1 putative nucleotidyltransferase [Breznakia sp. PFB2-8]MDF9859028.1 putative nucleotidyltransferase [Breznakia sp. PH5-24]
MKTHFKVAGIVCEYNPFHNGHMLHIQKTRAITGADILICVMSGNFVQRGEPAITNKWERAKVAIEHGVDIVVELPFIYATQSANMFAKGAIDILKLANIDALVFGSESNNLDILKKLLTIKDDISELKQAGISSAKAYEQLYGDLNPNDILGLNYLKHLKDTEIEAHTIQRTTNYHDTSLKGKISSATAIRESIFAQQDYTLATPMHNLSDTFQMQYYYPYIKTLLLTSDQKHLSQLFLMDEGIENNLIKHCKLADSYEDFLISCTSKRYTKASIQRTLTHLMNQTKKADVNNLPEVDYLRILAFNKRGQAYLNHIKEEVKIASKYSQIPSPYREMELKATQVYSYPTTIEEQKMMVKQELQPPLFIED